MLRHDQKNGCREERLVIFGRVRTVDIVVTAKKAESKCSSSRRCRSLDIYLNRRRGKQQQQHRQSKISLFNSSKLFSADRTCLHLLIIIWLLFHSLSPTPTRTFDLIRIVHFARRSNLFISMSSESMTSVALLKCEEYLEAERKDQCRFEHEGTTEQNLGRRRRRRSRTRLTRDNLAFNLMKLFLTHSTSSIDARLHSVATITIFQFPEYDVAQTVLFLLFTILETSAFFFFFFFFSLTSFVCMQNSSVNKDCLSTSESVTAVVHSPLSFFLSSLTPFLGQVSRTEFIRIDQKSFVDGSVHWQERGIIDREWKRKKRKGVANFVCLSDLMKVLLIDCFGTGLWVSSSKQNFLVGQRTDSNPCIELFRPLNWIRVVDYCSLISMDIYWLAKTRTTMIRKRNIRLQNFAFDLCVDQRLKVRV